MLINSSKGRYYSTYDQQYDKCKNCEMMGHNHKNCPEAQFIKCHYCMHNHKREECELDYCFQCAKGGHRSSNCPHKYEKPCRRCFKKGHFEADCAILLGFKNIGNRSMEHLKVSKGSVRCMNCSQLGHVECYLKGDIASKILRDGLYDRESMKLTAVEMNLGDFIEEEDLHPKVILSKNQRRRKLNELMHEEVEDRTLEAFNDYSRHEDSHRSSLNKRRPDRSDQSNAWDNQEYSFRQRGYRGGRFAGRPTRHVQSRRKYR